MSTWQMFGDADNNFRWEISGEQLRKEEQGAQIQIEAHRLPSMADLLLLGCSKLVESGNGDLDTNAPMFRTGLGNAVALKQSSLVKARSVLGDVLPDTGQLDGRENGYSFLEPKNRLAINVKSGLENGSANVVNMSNSMFQTGSGRENGFSFLKPKNQMAINVNSGLENGSANVVNMSNSMFQTGSGKSVNISSAGLLRAKALLGLEENLDQESLPRSRKTQKLSSSIKLPARENPAQLETKDLNNVGFSGFGVDSSTLRNESHEFPDLISTAANPPPVKFHTAGGRSISVSSDALQRARSLLGNPDCDSFLNEASTANPTFPVTDDVKPSCSSNKENDFSTPSLRMGPKGGDIFSRNFTSPLRLSSQQKQPFGSSRKQQSGNNLISKFDAEAGNNIDDSPYIVSTCNKNPLTSKSCLQKVDFSGNELQPKDSHSKRSSSGVLVDISNIVNTDCTDNKQHLGEKRRFGRLNSVSPFKKPRNSFVTPLNKNCSSATIALSRLAPKETCCKARVSMRYPPHVPRAYLKEYIVQPPSIERQLENLPNHVEKMNPNAAKSYVFHELASGTGPEDFLQMLSTSGASPQHLTKEWVANHYKWIVWKLASYERCYPTKFSGKLLTVSNVLEELKYRYEREVNHGHRSAIKKVLDGDAQPSSGMVLCISSVDENHDFKSEPQAVLSEGAGNGRAAKIELTDGWYSMKALLDELLSQKLASGKLYLGQKLRIWGAKLWGWDGPVSPFEASESAGLMLHINGTYRCHWAERLGFCKTAGMPLAFRCIKANGGTVPSTFVGITRLYPVLYRERLKNGSLIVRSERVETKVLQLHNQRQSVVAEGILSGIQRDTGVDLDDDHDCEEGAKLMKLLETAAEPELLMAGMSSKQLTSFAHYKTKLEAVRQSNMQKSIEKALEEAGLSEREVTPFLRVRVVGLTNNCHPRKHFPKEGLITIWNPTEKQKMELSEGQAYAVGGLLPSSSDSGTLYLQAKGSTTNWMPLSPLIVKNFEPFFTPRSAVTIAELGEVPLCCEFDIAALVVYVGEVYTQGQQRKQWAFVTDGSTPELCSKESLVAISFCLPYIQCDTFEPVNSNIAGSVVGFSNLIKRPRDKVNGLWVAEATENSDYFLSYDHAGRNHFKDAVASVSKWAKTSSLTAEKLKESVLSIISNSKVGC